MKALVWRVLVYLCLLSAGLHAQPMTAGPPEPESQHAQFDSVIDRLLPLDVAVSFRGDTAQVISLRMLHPDQQEFLSRIDVKTDGSAEITVIVPDGERLEDQVARMCQAGCPDVGQLVSGLHLRTSRIRSADYPAVRRLLADFNRLHIPTRLEPDLYLDAPRVDLSVNTSMNTLRVSLYGPGLQSKKSHPLIKWVEALRRSVQRL